MLRAAFVFAFLLICAPCAAGAELSLTVHGGDDCRPSDVLSGQCHPVCYDHVCPEGRVVPIRYG